MQAAHSQQFGQALLKAFGLEGQQVVELTMRLKPNNLISLEVTKVIGLDQMEKALHEISVYAVELTPRTTEIIETPLNHG